MMISRLGGLPAALSVLILGSAAAARAQGTGQSAPAASPASPQPQLAQPTVSQPQAASLGSHTPPLAPLATLSAQPAAPTAAPVSADIGLPSPTPAQNPPANSDLRSKMKEDEQHFHDKSAAAKSEFELRQTEEKKAFAATLSDKGFWERGRLKRQFRAAQAKRRREFEEEQAKKRRTYEWRYP